jgi:hypothetical protein
MDAVEGAAAGSAGPAPGAADSAAPARPGGVGADGAAPARPGGLKRPHDSGSGGPADAVAHGDAGDDATSAKRPRGLPTDELLADLE